MAPTDRSHPPPSRIRHAGRPVTAASSRSISPSPKFQHKSSSGTLPAPRVKQRAVSLDLQAGNVLWLRVMETKEAQWRMMNCLALHELEMQERRACTELDLLGRRLQKMVREADRLERIVEECREKRVRERVGRFAGGGVRRIVGEIERCGYRDVAEVLVEEERSVPGGDGLVDELERFCQVARDFVDGVGNREGVVQVGDGVGTVVNGVGCAMQAALGGAERERVGIVREIVRIREGR